MNVLNIIGGKPMQTILTVAPSDSLEDAAAILAEKRIGALIVSDGEKEVAGIISERDIVRRLGTEGASCLKVSVEAAMTKNVVSCEPADSALSVLKRMTEGRFRHMPVVKEGKLIGVISIGDVVKARMSEIEMENRAMEDMIKGM